MAWGLKEKEKERNEKIGKRDLIDKGREWEIERIGWKNEDEKNNREKNLRNGRRKWRKEKLVLAKMRCEKNEKNEKIKREKGKLKDYENMYEKNKNWKTCEW